MTMSAAPTSWPCAICRKPSVPRVHDGCRQHLDDNLAALPGLYAKLEDTLVPGQRGSDGRTGTRTPPMPANADALDLRARGGIEGILGGWVRDVCEIEGWTCPYYGRVETAVTEYVRFLRNNLLAICDTHPAVREIAVEVGTIRGQAERLVNGEPGERKIPLLCDGLLDDGSACGATIKITISTIGKQCPRCGTQRDRQQLLGLTPTRAAA
ncbi:hypothetical protein OG539_32690 [Actinacidiphila glaucinigra]|uniref:hypothetical protein n=1 Tax=Actinacidiphila glaucinigra TaxID=235986 RepID=UPI00324B302A